MPTVPLATNRLRVLRFWLCALTFAALTPPSSGQPSEPVPAGTSLPSADQPVRYRVEIVAPNDVAAALRSAVDLIRWQDYAEMTEDLFDRLARDAVPQARRGRRDARVLFGGRRHSRRSRGTARARGPRGRRPAIPLIVQSVAIDVNGPANDSPEGRAAIARLREEWLLPKGDKWRQETWTSAKNLAVGTLAASPYAAAKTVASEARIEPTLATADLSLTLDSGPAFRIGRIDVQGLKRYTPSSCATSRTCARAISTASEVLDDYVRRLLASNYFASVQVSIDPDVAHADDATVTLSIIEGTHEATSSSVRATRPTPSAA